MKFTVNSAPPEPADLLIRMHNQVAAAVDVTGTRSYSRWYCHGCGSENDFKQSLLSSRREANSHAAQCRAAYHRLT